MTDDGDLWEAVKFDEIPGARKEYSSNEYRRKPTQPAFYTFKERAYDLFARLGGVRNGGGIAPVAANRGRPEDTSDEYDRLVGQWLEDGHSHSWCTLDEATGINEWFDDFMRPLRGMGEIRLCFFFDN